MSQNRMYACLEIKSVEAVGKKRIFTGTASTVETDRTGDVVEAKGAQFKLPLPLLWQHDKNQPIGWVTSAKVTRDGIEVVGEVAEVEEEGDLKRRLDTVWQTLKAKLVRGLSIGFRAIDAEPIKGTFGIRFLKWEWLELSAVTVAANASASIATIKSLDSEQRAAPGTSAAGVVRLDPSPGASGTTTPSKPQEGHVKTIQEQITDLEANIATKQARMTEVMQKSAGEGRSTDAAEAEEFDTLSGDVTTLQADLVRLKSLETINKATATPVGNAGTQREASSVRQGVSVVQHEKLEPGILFARYAMCLGVAKGNHEKAFQLAQKHYPLSESIIKTLKYQAEGADLAQMFQQKATVPAGTTTDSTWAAPLVVAQNWGGDFVEFLRARTLIGQAQFRDVPFNVSIGGQTTGGAAKWVGEGKSKPATKFDFIRYTTSYNKVAAISYITKELLRLSDPSAERLVRDGLADAVVERIDSDLFDPDIAAVSGVNPAGLLNGVSPVAGPTGPDPDDFQCAIDRLWAPWDTLFMGARPAYYTTPAVARRLAGLRDALGNRAFPNMTMTGGNIDGVPVRTSQYLANNGGSAGAPFILVDEAEIWLADDGSVTLDFSDHATIEMSDTPVGSSSASVTSNGSPFVNMFQTNSRAFLAERHIWWGKRRTGAVQWIDGMPTNC